MQPFQEPIPNQGMNHEMVDTYRSGALARGSSGKRYPGTKKLPYTTPLLMDNQPNTIVNQGSDLDSLSQYSSVYGNQP